MATNFLEATGGSTAGYFSAVTVLLSTELPSLGSSIVTSAGGTILTSSGSVGQAIWAEVAVVWGGAITPVAGGNLAGWFLRSLDGGTTFETVGSSVSPLARPPDYVIPLSTLAYANTNVCYASGLVKLPWSPFKGFLQNNTGATLPTSATAYTQIKIAPVAVQY